MTFYSIVVKIDSKKQQRTNWMETKWKLTSNTMTTSNGILFLMYFNHWSQKPQSISRTFYSGFRAWVINPLKCNPFVCKHKSATHSVKFNKMGKKRIHFTNVPMDNRPYLGLNFINVLRAAFMLADPKCTKKKVKLAVLFGTFGTYERKNCT